MWRQTEERAVRMKYEFQNEQCYDFLTQLPFPLAAFPDESSHEVLLTTRWDFSIIPLDHRAGRAHGVINFDLRKLY